MDTVWILMVSTTSPATGVARKGAIEAIFADKVKAEAALRHMKDTDDGRGFIYYIREHEVTR
jgi:hypothetical protein